MKAREIMTPNPVCCRISDTAEDVARALIHWNIGCVPVLSDTNPARIEGIVTDRDICVSVVALGLNPKTTTVGSFLTRDPVTCSPEQSLTSCQRLMQMRQVRRIPIIDQSGTCVGILSQADVARWASAENVHKTMLEISRPQETFACPSEFPSGTLSIIRQPPIELQMYGAAWQISIDASAA
ncbi:MAG TPA: CBS domain-containing protein [Acidobacteriaceae bacterium]